MSFGNFGSKPMKTPKAPKALGKKPFSSRTVIGFICIVLALLITFGVAPLVNRFTDQKVDIVRLKADVSRGQIITADHLEVVNVGSYNLPKKVIKDAKAVVGKYAATDLCAGDYLFDSKLSTNNKSADDVLLGLDGKKVAISVNISDLAAGLSDKLENGDIVSVIIYDKENNVSYTPSAFKYVKVITTTTNEGVDKDESVEGGKAATVTVLVTPEQAELLAHYNSVTTIHFTLVYRGEADKADAYIKVQDDYLKNNPIDNTPKETEAENNG
jgi:pilus assembly protein CpaB